MIRLVARGVKPANDGIPVRRNFPRNSPWSGTASQVMQALENNFAGFVNTAGGNTFHDFQSGVGFSWPAPLVSLTVMTER